MAERTPPDRVRIKWPARLGWAAWVCAVYIFGTALVVFWTTGVGCKPPGADSPGGWTYFSLWPFGPGCEFFDWSRGPSPVWSIVLLVLVATGIALTRLSGRRDVPAE